VKAMKQYVKHSKLQQAALVAIAVQASPDDIKELRDTFIALDANGDGSLTFEELSKGLGHRENAETLLSVLKAADTDNSGKIDYTEFIAATIDQQTYMRDDYLHTAFNMFDIDGSGSIDKTEILKLL
jgi:calcium-dependent protein kinase